MVNYSSWAQQQYPAPNDLSNLGINWGPSGTDMITQTAAPQDWSSALMMGPPASAMGGGPSIPQIGATGPFSGGSGNWWDGATGPNGWGGLALNAAGGLASTIMGMKQYGLAKKTLAENKRQFQLNYDAQKQTTNARLEGRQAARVSRDPTAYQSVGDYMNKNRIV